MNNSSNDSPRNDLRDVDVEFILARHPASQEAECVVVLQRATGNNQIEGFFYESDHIGDRRQ
jgi:hypothetical protein